MFSSKSGLLEKVLCAAGEGGLHRWGCAVMDCEKCGWGKPGAHRGPPLFRCRLVAEAVEALASMAAAAAAEDGEGGPDVRGKEGVVVWQYVKRAQEQIQDNDDREQR